MPSKRLADATTRRDSRAVVRSPVITFTPFHLDLPGGRLLCGDQAIPLRPKTWAVLLYLTEHPGVLVTKDELLDAVWPETAVTPDTLNKSIGEVRVALGDDSHAPRFVETVHRRGFRFIAKVQVSGSESLVPGSREDKLETRDQQPGTVFVGRENELHRLATSFVRAQTGERQVVFITGPAGIGKTAVVDAFISRLENGAWRQNQGPAPSPQPPAPIWIGRGGCIEHHGSREAYFPVLEALERLARRTDGGRLLELLRRTAPMWLLQMPWLVEEAEMQALQQSLQAVRAERMLREFAGLLEALTKDLTLVLVLEDLHWSDPSTVDLLSHLGQRRDPARLLVIGTYRPADVAVQDHVLGSAVRTLQVHRQCVELSLPDLSEDGVRSYLAARFRGGDFPPALARLIHAHTRGDPLFMVAIVDHMLARGWILDTAPGWTLSAPPENIDLGVPDDVRLIIETQFHRLSPSERSLLEAASVAGSDMAVPVAAEALGCSLDDAERTCETLARNQRFLRTAGSTEWPDGSVARRYAFTHELHRQVVYDGISDGRRVRLHRRVGQVLEAVYGAQALDMAPQLTAHFERGHDHARALHYLVAAGARARQRFANREAVQYFESALAVVALLPDADERRRRELEVRRALGAALSEIRGFTADDVGRNYDRAAELCATVGSAAERFEVLYALWYLHALRAERDEAISFAAELDDLARQLGKAEQVLADSVLVRTALYDRRFTDARAHMESLLARQNQGGDVDLAFAYGVDPVIAATMHYALALWFLGDPQQAQTTARTGLARARHSGNLFSLCAVLVQGAILDLFCRNTAEAGDLVEEAVSLSSEQSFAYWKGIASALRGWARVQQGAAAAGSDELERTLAVLQAMGARLFSTVLYAALAEGRLQAGALADGLAAANEGLALAQTTLDRVYEPELWRLKGELLLASPAAERRRSQRGKRAATSPAATDPHWQEAERCLLRALEVARAAEAKSLELRAATSIARAWHARGRSAEAHTLLTGICGWFGADGRSPDLAEAKALRDERGMIPARSTPRAG